MFSLQNQTAKLTSVNPRAEIHGADRVMAADLKFEIKVPNDVLSEFDPSLKSALYRKPDESDSQAELAIDDPGYLSKLKFPMMGAIKWNKEFAGDELVVHYGVSGRDDIALTAKAVDNFRFDCQDGGTVNVSFRVIAHPKPEELGRLCEMIQQECEISLIPPSPADLADQALKQAA